MYLPRRFRRRLLLPSGWVALGSLLWLGCLVLGTHWRRLRQENVLQLTMPSMRRNPAYKSYYTMQFTVQSARQDIYRIQHWRKLKFTGRGSDSLVASRVAAALVALDNKTQPSQGLAILFSSSTHYRYLVAVLDLLNQHNVKRYMLDDYQVPTTLYVLGSHAKLKQRQWLHQPQLPLPLELR